MLWSQRTQLLVIRLTLVKWMTCLLFDGQAKTREGSHSAATTTNGPSSRKFHLQITEGGGNSWNMLNSDTSRVSTFKSPKEKVPIILWYYIWLCMIIYGHFFTCVFLILKLESMSCDTDLFHILPSSLWVQHVLNTIDNYSSTIGI